MIAARAGKAKVAGKGWNMENKKLYRSKRNRMIAGVCGGLGDYLNVDPTLVRLIMVLLVFGATAGIWIYLVAAIVIPNEDYE